jgi:hypothetical protein
MTRRSSRAFLPPSAGQIIRRRDAVPDPPGGWPPWLAVGRGAQADRGSLAASPSWLTAARGTARRRWPRTRPSTGWPIWPRRRPPGRRATGKQPGGALPGPGRTGGGAGRGRRLARLPPRWRSERPAAAAAGHRAGRGRDLGSPSRVRCPGCWPRRVSRAGRRTPCPAYPGPVRCAR